MFQSGLQRLHEIKALIGCYSQAGTRMSQINCLKSIIIGTSNTALHEETSVGLLKFNLNDKSASNFKAILELSVQGLTSTKSILTVLGLSS